jgi:hypothetical protein
MFILYHLKEKYAGEKKRRTRKEISTSATPDGFVSSKKKNIPRLVLSYFIKRDAFVIHTIFYQFSFHGIAMV